MKDDEQAEEIDDLRQKLKAVTEIVLMQTMVLSLTLRKHEWQLAKMIEDRLNELPPHRRVEPYGLVLQSARKYCLGLDDGLNGPTEL